MPRFFYNSQIIEVGAVYTLTETLLHHLKVRRLRAQDSITLFNGLGSEYRSVIVSMSQNCADVLILEKIDICRELPFSLTLAQGLCSNEKMDWLIEKSIELGVLTIQPLITAKSMIRIKPERIEQRMKHWQKLSWAACTQSGRNVIPKINAPLPLSKWIKNLNDNNQDQTLKIMPTLRGQYRFENLPKGASNNVIVLIGPEAGLHEEEETEAIKAEFIDLRLGQRVLRAETAGIALIAALNGLWHGF